MHEGGGFHGGVVRAGSLPGSIERLGAPSAIYQSPPDAVIGIPIGSCCVFGLARA